jgi:hypothetical protein
MEFRGVHVRCSDGLGDEKHYKVALIERPFSFILISSSNQSPET